MVTILQFFILNAFHNLVKVVCGMTENVYAYVPEVIVSSLLAIQHCHLLLVLFAEAGSQLPFLCALNCSICLFFSSYCTWCENSSSSPVSMVLTLHQKAFAMKLHFPRLWINVGRVESVVYGWMNCGGVWMRGSRLLLSFVFLWKHCLNVMGNNGQPAPVKNLSRLYQTALN